MNPPVCARPALLTRMSIRPKVANVSPTTTAGVSGGRDVRRDGERPDLTRTGVDRFRRGIEPVLVPRNEDDDGAVVDELLSDGEADAFARACDDGDPTGQPKIHGYRPFKLES